MAFQFLCPQGHLLQGDESQAGQQCKCPYCEAVFIVPQPTPPAGAHPGAAQTFSESPDQGQPAPQFGYDQPGYQQPAADAQAGPAGGGFPGVQAAPSFSGSPGGESPAAGQLPGGEAQQVVHVICPSGHELETPREMLGQDAMCPFCQTQFRLRFESTREYRQQKADERERREMKRGKAWMNWSIAAAVVVVLGVILLIVLAVSQ